jgi:serine/threonine-protein kinase
MGMLNINSSPVSSVVVDGKPIGSTPKVGYPVSAGLHRVMFVHPRLGRMQVLAEVKPGQSSTAAVKFEERPIGGSVQSPGF